MVWTYVTKESEWSAEGKYGLWRCKM